MSKLKVLSLGLIISSVLMLSACSSAQAIPHSLEGRSDCLSCHATGTANPYPDGHAKKAYNNDRCTKCHKAPPAAQNTTIQP